MCRMVCFIDVYLPSVETFVILKIRSLENVLLLMTSLRSCKLLCRQNLSLYHFVFHDSTMSIMIS